MKPSLAQLLHLIEEMPLYHTLMEELKRHNETAGVSILDAAKPYLIAALRRSLDLPVLVVTAQPGNSKKLHDQLSAWCDSPVMLFPETDALPYERVAADASTELERVKVLSALANCDGSEPGMDTPLVIASAPALMGKTAPYTDFTAACHTVTGKMNIDPFKLLGRWEAMGYRMDSLVEVPGAMSHRGGIIDIYPPTSELPVRLEFFGDTVDSIRLFDPSSQRSVREVESIVITPATELLSLLSKDRKGLKQILGGLDMTGCAAEVKEQYKQEITMLLEGQRLGNVSFYASLFNRGNLLDYLPDNALLIIDEPLSIEQAVGELEAEAEQIRSDKLQRGELPGDFPRPYFIRDELQPEIRNRRGLLLTTFGADEGLGRLNFISAQGYSGQLQSFVKKTGELIARKHRLIIVSQQASRLSELLDEDGIISMPVTEVTQIPEPGSLVLVQGSLAEGWVMNNDTCLFTDAEIFGFVKQRRLTKKRLVPRHKLYVDITPDDYVVHIEHGIAKFTGVTTLSSAGGKKEYLVLQYAAGDRLYVPIDQIDRVNRYIGSGGRAPVLSRLGTQEWTRSKQKAREAAEELAQELLALYASREVVPGFAFVRDTVWQQELEASFPYVETPDQLEAQREIKQDMEKAKPMDRLVCGDVGYGKTEVAIRAAFKAVMDNKQVAVLVPTTVLAEQHFTTFSGRLNAFPLKIEVLSRFKSPGEQRDVLERLASGQVDICIGTHRLIQKDVVFKDLGLLIIDEEQRFGVAHKEHFKKMRREVDVLTLSATPIPRTLHMSLVGVRDMSTMETPPEERLPVKTFVSEYNESLIREAILRELERNGQVFFVHNRVQSIAMVASRLKELVPEARVAIAHGQMHEEKLEEVMADFSRGKSDVLLCTTIIESGLDMPNVNTVIVNRADRFGLTQLYQLRGRVGRGTNLAYAYFLYDRSKNLTPAAQKRLRAIYEATELGAGFNIAMKDLEIRGAGTLLGPKQSGHISVIGFSLYCRMLAEAVEGQKTRLAGRKPATPRLPAPTIDLPLMAYIPDAYVADVSTRLELYQNLARVETVEQVDDMAQEYNDRFGSMPPEVVNLLYAVRIKLLASGKGIESISTDEEQIIIRLFEGMQFTHRQRGMAFPDGVKTGLKQIRLDRKKLGRRWKGVLEEVVGKMGRGR